MLRKSLLLLLCMAAAISLNAQQLYRDGYILKSPLDTIKGEIKYISYNKAANNCVFRDINGTERSYGPSEIFGYGIGKELVFHAKEPKETGPIFLELVYQGSAILYSYRDTNQRNFFFLESPATGEFSLLTQKVVTRGRKQRVLKPYVAVLKFMLPEHELVADEIENTPLTSKGLTRLLVAYDQRYSNTLGISYSGTSPKVPARFGILLGGSTSKLKLSGHRGKDLDNIFSVGVRMEKEISRNTGRLFIDADLLISSESYNGTYDANQEVNTGDDVISNFINIRLPASFVGILGAIDYSTTIDLDRTVISIPVNLKYKLPGQHFNFTFGGGMEFQYATSDEVLVNGLILQNGNVQLDVLSVEKTNPFRFGTNFGFGISYNAKRTLFLDFRHSPAWLDQGALNYAYTRVILGVMLKKNKD